VGDKSITAAFDGQDFTGYVFKTTLVRQARNWNFNVSYLEVPPFSGWLTALVLWFTQCLCLLLYPELFFRHLRGTGFRCG